MSLKGGVHEQRCERDLLSCPLPSLPWGASNSCASEVTYLCEKALGVTPTRGKGTPLHALQTGVGGICVWTTEGTARILIGSLLTHEGPTWEANCLSPKSRSLHRDT